MKKQQKSMSHKGANKKLLEMEKLGMSTTRKACSPLDKFRRLTVGHKIKAQNIGSPLDYT